MRDINDCPMMPDYPTLDGKAIVPDISDVIRPIDGFSGPVSMRNYELTESDLKQRIDAHIASALPVLAAIGLTEALLAVEKVLAWNETEKHPNAKWKSKSIGYHDAKAVGHLNWSQCGILDDYETEQPHRAHAACRLLMSLALELQQNQRTKI